MREWINILTESADPNGMMSLDPWTFDQTQAGWRTLPPADQIRTLKAYIARYIRNGHYVEDTPPSKKTLEPAVLLWHLGQALAFSGRYPEAVDYMKQSKLSDDAEWNAYIDATIAFIKKDKEAFVSALKGDNYNGDTLQRLKAAWGKPYKDAY